MTLNNITKMEEGLYTVDSLPCPQCGDVLQVVLEGDGLFKYNNGASVQEVLPDLSAADRERFITGLCGPCWKDMFS